MVNGPSIEISDASKSFLLGGGKSVRALDGLDLTIAAGSFLVLMGPNGSGKTTLLRAIERSITLDRGMIILNTDSGTRKPSRVVHISQDPVSRTFSKLTVAEHFLMAELEGSCPSLFRLAVDKDRRKRYAELLSAFGREDLTPFLNSPVSELSGGMRQALSLLTAAVSAPTYDRTNHLFIMLDEPTGSLDVKNEERCLDLVERLHLSGATILLVTHDPQLAAKRGDGLAIMHRGKLFAYFSSSQKKNLDPTKITNLVIKLVGDSLVDPATLISEANTLANDK